MNPFRRPQRLLDRDVAQLGHSPKLDAARRHFRKTIGSDDKHTCAECGKAYCTNHDLEKHAAKTKHGAFHCACEERRATFTKLSSLRRHITESEAPGKYRCPLKFYLCSTHDCCFSYKRLSHLKKHFLSERHYLSKKEANDLLKKYKLVAQRGGRRKGKGRNEPQPGDVADAAGTSESPEAGASRSPEPEIWNNTAEQQGHGLAGTSSSSVPSDVRSPESGDASTAEQPVTGSVGYLLTLGHGNPTATTNNIGFGSGMVGATTAIITSPGADSSMSFLSPASEIDLGDALGTAVTDFDPDMSSFNTLASQTSFSDIFGAGVPAQHGITAAPHQPVSVPIFGYPQAFNHIHGSYMGQYTMPGLGANTMGTPAAMWTPTGFTPNMFQHQVYPAGVQFPATYLPPPRLAAPSTNWSQTMDTFTPYTYPTGMAPPFGVDTLNMGSATLNTTAVTNTFVEDGPFSLPAVSGSVDNTSLFGNWNGASY